MAKRGNDILRAAEERILAERAKQTLAQQCAFCGESWSGLAGDVIPAAQAHRMQFHPEATSLRRAKRKLGAPRSVSARTLDDNIAAARAQGASVWWDADLPPA